jgi:hypothetical protein
MAWRRPPRPFVAQRDGHTALNLTPDERQALGRLLPQLGDLFDTPADPGVRRLFPTAYPADPERDADYQRLMREELVTSRSVALTTVIETLEATELDADQLNAWLQTLNAARLVLGTRLDVGEDEHPLPTPSDTDPDAAAHLTYLWLSELLEFATRAASDTLS